MYLTMLVLFIGCSAKDKNIQTNTLPEKKTFVKKEKNNTPSNRNAYYPPVPPMGGYYPAPMGYSPRGGYSPYRHQYNNGGGVGYYMEPLGNGPISYQNSAEDIENQRQGRD